MGDVVKRDALGRLLPGSAMVPGSGRPKGFKGFAAALMKNERPNEIRDWLWGVFRNENKVHTHRDQIEVLKIILDRGLGKPLNTVIELETEDHPAMLPLDEISPEGLSDVAKALAKALEIK